MIENVFQTEQVRIERIVSTGQASPPGFWYDQTEGEWVIVLRGEATLKFKDGTTKRRLTPGDYIYIPPHKKHRVSSTSEKQTTVWLAVFVKDSRERQHWNIRTAVLDDIPVLKSLYRDTITTVCTADYKSDQIQAWVGTAERTDSLAKRIGTQHFCVAESKTAEIVGFASFEEPGYLDMMYVHKDFQRLGVGNALLSKICEKAMEVGTARIVSDVSITARPFFEKNGFKLLKKQTVKIGNVELTNYKMEKTIMQIAVSTV
ncbi:MAG: GNAT family N-acetyltransferase, partial [Planctomycetaceae bacterium]|nr:GNAT family N-acetyltransferase [Planctomycetaceae bacterium]